VSLLEAAIGIIAPPQCVGCGAEGSALCPECLSTKILPYGERCAFCDRLSLAARTCLRCQHLGGPRFIWVATNYESHAQKLVQAYKFGHLRQAAQPISTLMATAVLRYFLPTQLHSLKYLVVPLPTASSRARQRGFDHSSVLAKTIASKLGMEYCTGLNRLGQSRQVGASRSNRLTQQLGNYFAAKPQRIIGRNILLVDDVITTGGSLIAATKSLRTAGATRVDALVFAKRL